MKIKQTPSDQFATATDNMLCGGTLDMATTEAIASELELARELRTSAEAAMPDPSFVDGLRQELRLRVDAMAARSRPASVRYGTMKTPVGTLGLAYRDGRVVYCARIDASPPGPLSSVAGEGEAQVTAFERGVARELGVWPERDAALPAPIERGVRDHLSGKRRFTAVDLSWLTPFQRRVLEKTAEIPRGEVRPYGWVAREIGAPGAVRAVGTALGHNPIPFLIPCHRVVRSDGSLGEYSGGGPAAKERVLTLEGVPVADLRAAAGGRDRYHGSSTTRIVCYPTCHAARRIRPENAVPFASLAEARASGYRPCALCRPA